MNTEHDLEEALANCDREQIHIPETIQSFGALIATDRKLKNIEFASLNTNAMLGFDAKELLEQPIEIILEQEIRHKARNCLSHATIQRQRQLVGEKSFQGQLFQISIHLQDERAILEFIPASNTHTAELDALERTRMMLADTVAVDDFQAVLDTTAQNLWISTQYDRVKAYRFLPSGAGEVVAEFRTPNTESFLGMRFPASDIPPVARKLYATTPIRVIANVNSENIPVLSSDPKGRPLDMSLAILRGNSEVHLNYLRNMGVKSTMTLPITVGGELWGLFSCHHMEARKMDPTELIACELSGKMLSLSIEHTKQTRHLIYLNKCKEIANQLAIDGRIISVDSYWNSSRNELIQAIPSRGIAYLVDELVYISGSAPDEEAVMKIRDMAANDNNQIQHYDDLPAKLPDSNLKKTAGALVLPLTSSSNQYVILFRDHASNEIKWAGAPTKEVTQTEEGLKLNPRSSFESYHQSVIGMSDEWTHDDREIGEALQIELSGALESERERSENRLRLMVQELNHRVRNILSLVQSLSSNSKATATSLEGYAKALESRIIALAGAHDLLTRDDLTGVMFEEVAKLELKPHIDNESQSAFLDGPAVSLTPDAAPIVTLVIHELITNAVKYGSLSQAGGSVHLSWTPTKRGLEIEWLEKGGPTVKEPEHEGFGRSLIENAIPYEFGGEASTNYAPAGLHAKFLLPHDTFTTTEKYSKPSFGIKKASNLAVNSNFKMQRALIVEDNYVVAMENKRWFEEFGFEEIVTVTSVSAALEELENHKIDFCMLDVNLRGNISKPVAEKLTELKVPYIFATGYGSEGHELCQEFDTPFLTKPVNINQVREVLKDMGIAK